MNATPLQPGKSFVATLRTKPEKREEFIALQTELKRLVHAYEPDAWVYELLQSDDDPDLFYCIATFRDEAAFEHHMHIDFHDRLVPPVLECLAQDMELAFFKSHQ
ncbi:putative quinol monooxygenase [Sphingobium algorifonticola]|uniref:Antibiotic biosynthesis monooxygenase n=1 Tax=Sphingobium algorifonticola TaxID=2008318 RepID=A0A437JD41_9SPHN|nr:antibiotic biosynthesis monooxygenase family protein [Sphingobium algorifonticola]RVT43542.1 antibiotic biosynthesis monooxygenase [Sphingobium algorifonticola]